MAEASGTKPPPPERAHGPAGEKAANEASQAVERQRRQEDLERRRQRRSLRARMCEELQFVKAVAIILAYYAIAIWYYRDEEQWSLIDCVYFAVVTCTATGYGDLVPSSDKNKGFTIGFAFAGVLGVMFAIQIVGEWMARWQSKLTEAANRRMLRATQEAADRNKSRRHERKDPTAKGYNKKLEALKAATANTSRVTSVVVLWCTSCWRGSAARASRLDQWLLAHGGKRWASARKMVLLVLHIVVPIIAYIGLGAFLGPFEGWTAAESFYFSSITMLTIGYGDLVPTTQAGRLFCIFYIPMAVGVLWKTFTTMHAFRLRARTQKMTLKALLMMDEDFDGKVSEAEFMRAHLQAVGFSPVILGMMKQQFAILDRSQSGFLDTEDMEATADIEMEVVGDASTAATAMQRNAKDRAKKAAAADDAGLALDPSAKPRGVERVLV